MLIQSLAIVEELGNVYLACVQSQHLVDFTSQMLLPGKYDG